MRSRLPAIWIFLVGAVAFLSGCSAANRAAVHEEDMHKVFPWPRGKTSVSIRVRPMTTMAKTCFLFGSYDQVEVTPETTFYIVDESEKNFAYTPGRSPIRRLAKLKSMEILWPQKKPEARPPEEVEDKPAEKQPEKKTDKEAPRPKQ
jgi:hypothetical protein